MMRQVVVDTETTGLSVDDGHRIIEVAAVELVNRKLTGKRFHSYVYPARSIDAGAVAVHGLTLEFLADKPPFHVIADELLAFVRDAQLVIHNAPFDLAFLDHEFRHCRPQTPPLENLCPILDTLALARRKHPGQSNSLDALCQRYGIDRSERQLHGALLDAHLLVAVYLAMTGGQTSLFPLDSGPTFSEGQLSPNVFVRPSTLQLRVISATSEELAAHRARLDQIAQFGSIVESW